MTVGTGRDLSLQTKTDSMWRNTLRRMRKKTIRIKVESGSF